MCPGFIMLAFDREVKNVQTIYCAMIRSMSMKKQHPFVYTFRKELVLSLRKAINS